MTDTLFPLLKSRFNEFGSVFTFDEVYFDSVEPRHAFQAAVFDTLYLPPIPKTKRMLDQLFSPVFQTGIYEFDIKHYMFDYIFIVDARVKNGIWKISRFSRQIVSNQTDKNRCRKILGLMSNLFDLDYKTTHRDKFHLLIHRTMKSFDIQYYSLGSKRMKHHDVSPLFLKFKHTITTYPARHIEYSAPNEIFICIYYDCNHITEFVIHFYVF
jgi:hypothetical protein